MLGFLILAARLATRMTVIDTTVRDIFCLTLSKDYVRPLIY
jgi:hypothetical protein